MISEILTRNPAHPAEIILAPDRFHAGACRQWPRLQPGAPRARASAISHRDTERARESSCPCLTAVSLAVAGTSPRPRPSLFWSCHRHSFCVNRSRLAAPVTGLSNSGVTNISAFGIPPRKLASEAACHAARSLQRGHRRLPSISTRLTKTAPSGACNSPTPAADGAFHDPATAPAA